MSLASEIRSVKERLQSILDNSNAAIADIGGTAVENLSGIPAAITGIGTSDMWPIADWKSASKWNYNGTELDALPDWDREEYPYAFITYNTAGFYSLYVLSVEGGPSSAGNKTFVPTGETGYYMSRVFGDGHDFSERIEFKYGFLSSVTEGLIWANYDVKYKSTGDMYLSKSVPVPVLS